MKPWTPLAIGTSVLSLAGPGVQVERDIAVAVRRARECNDFLAEKMRDQPRFGGLAHLAMQDPGAAADELERCMSNLGYQGAMINGQTNGSYLDDDRFSPFWERVEALGAPIYIHPSNPPMFPTCITTIASSSGQSGVGPWRPPIMLCD